MWDVLLLEMDQAVMFRAMLAIVDQQTKPLLCCQDQLTMWHKLAGLPMCADAAELLDATNYHFSSLTT
jgi:hypothetical protein